MPLDSRLLSVYIIAFFIYSYVGATLEHLSYYGQKLFNPSKYLPKCLSNSVITGFPLYGIGAFVVVGIHHFVKDIPLALQFFVYGAVLSAMEFTVGCFVGAGCTVDGTVPAWDYTDQPYNIGGKISLRHFISWGLLGILVSWLHPVIVRKIKGGITA